MGRTEAVPDVRRWLRGALSRCYPRPSQGAGASGSGFALLCHREHRGELSLFTGDRLRVTRRCDESRLTRALEWHTPGVDQSQLHRAGWQQRVKRPIRCGAGSVAGQR